MVRVKNFFLIGEKVILRPLEEDDAFGAYPGWINNPIISQNNSHHTYPYSKEQAVDFIRALSNRKDIIVLAVINKKNNEHVGNISLQSINYINRCAELAILLGQTSIWGKGFGKEACSLFVHHAFTALNLIRVELGTPAENIGMQKVAQWVGMRHEGVKRKAFFKNGKYQDIYLFAVLREEFIDKFSLDI